MLLLACVDGCSDEDFDREEQGDGAGRRGLPASSDARALSGRVLTSLGVRFHFAEC